MVELVDDSVFIDQILLLFKQRNPCIFINPEEAHRTYQILDLIEKKEVNTKEDVNRELEAMRFASNANNFKLHSIQKDTTDHAQGMKRKFVDDEIPLKDLSSTFVEDKDHKVVEDDLNVEKDILYWNGRDYVREEPNNVVQKTKQYVIRSRKTKVCTVRKSLHTDLNDKWLKKRISQPKTNRLTTFNNHSSQVQCTNKVDRLEQSNLKQFESRISALKNDFKAHIGSFKIPKKSNPTAPPPLNNVLSQPHPDENPDIIQPQF